MKFLVYVTVGDKETVKEFSTLDEAWGFVPQALKLKEKAPTLKVKVRKQFSSKEIVEPHWGDVKRGANGTIYYPNGNPIRELIKFGHKGKLYYCPICGYHTEFKVDSFHGLKRCSCWCTENDFYFKSINGTWNMKKSS